MSIMLPSWDGQGWIWPQLEVKTSEQPGAGLGLFAKAPLRSGTMIPYRGRSTTNCGTYVFEGQDGDPAINPYKGIGNGGWSVVALANEPTRKKPRCILFRTCLVVAQPIGVGEELTVYYGEAYTRDGYSLRGNRYLYRFHSRLDKSKLATVSQVETAIDGLRGSIDISICN